MNEFILLAQKYPNLNVTIGLAVLLEFGRFLVDETKSQLEKSINDEAGEKYLTPQKVSELLCCNLATIWRHDKRGYLKPVYFGAKKRYKYSDIRKILEEGKTK